MQPRVLTSVIVLVIMQLPAHPLQACGDKFLMIGKGAKYRQAYAAIYPASVVVFAHPDRAAAKAILDPRLLADLKLAGHRVSVIRDEGTLSQTMATGRVDVLLTDAADADRLTQHADAAPGRPGVLPVAVKPTKEEAKAIEARYHCLLKSGDRSARYLAAIDDLMKARKRKA
jgi:hypothetical protein